MSHTHKGHMYVVDVSNIQSETMMNIIIYRRRVSLFDVRDVYKNEIIHWMNAKRCVWTYILVSWFCERLDGFPGAQSEILQKKGIKPLFLTAWSVWVYVKCVMKFVLRLSHYFYFVINITSRLERYPAVSLPPPCLLSLPTAMTQKSFHLISITSRDNVSFPFRHRKSA